MNATIAPLPGPVMDYIAAFDLAAVCQYRDGRLGVILNPAGAVAAWWCEAVKARPLIRGGKATQLGHSGGCTRSPAGDVQPPKTVRSRCYRCAPVFTHLS